MRPFLLLLFAAPACAQMQVASITVSGNVRLGAPAIVDVTGLRTGTKVTRLELDAAVQALADTGLFASVSYRYDPVSGKEPSSYRISFPVQEGRADIPVTIDIPGLDEEAAWKELRIAAPMVDRKMPSDDRAMDYYCRALEAVLRKMNREEKVVAINRADLRTKRVEISLVLANTPSVSHVSFEGARVLAAPMLSAVIEKVATGNRYLEREFRQVLDLNVRPLYEERGYLKVEFPSLRLAFSEGSVAVSVQVVEGMAWILGKVEVAGDAIPRDEMVREGGFATGKIVNWQQVLESIARMEKVLKRDGYLAASSKPVRLFRDQGQIVDLRIDVNKGRQFLFGEMSMAGMNPSQQERARSIWKLRSGDALNQPYLDEFAKAVFEMLPRTFRSFHSQLRQRPNTSVMDVIFTFK
jgi:outer membrane protein assembly factor BamA